MVSKFTFVFALVALFVIQDATALRIDPKDEKSLQDLVQKAKEAIQRLHDLIHGKITQAQDHLKQILEEIKAKADRLFAETKKKFDEAIEKVKERIAQIKKEAEILGVDIKECLIENEDKLIAIPRDMLQKLLQCLTDEVVKAKEIIMSAIQEIIDIKNDLVDLPKKLKSCLGTTNPVKCISGVLSDVVKKIAQLPVDIQTKINQIIDLVNHLEENLIKCALTKLAEVTKEAGQVGIDIANCVAHKINEQ